MFKTEAWWMMQPKIIKYSQRLGDILRCLPACKFLSDKGHRVLFDCLEIYHGIFDMVSYAQPLGATPFDADILELEIWPNKYVDYRKSRKSWGEFVYSHNDIKGADRENIVIDRLCSERAIGLPEKYHLIAPFGVSQNTYHNPLKIIQEAARELGKDNVIVLCPGDVRIEGIATYTAPSVEQMAKAVRDADQFWAINSAPIILASSVRRGKESKFWGQKGEFESDNVPWFEGLVRMD
jgi:hypothetical protein